MAKPARAAAPAPQDAPATPTPSPVDTAMQEVEPEPGEDVGDGTGPGEDDEETSLAPKDFPLPEKGVRWPEAGVQVYYVTFKAKWTSTPSKGDRTCVIWHLSPGEEKAAGKKSATDARVFLTEASKAMIRVIDGKVADHLNPTEANVSQFWTDIGPKCRAQMESLYVKLHHMGIAEMAEFFTDCVAARTVAV